MSVVQASITSEYESQVVTKAVKKLYGDEKTADVYFVFKSGERIPAHKILLAAASDVFDAMFYGSIKEDGDVKIDDASAVGFKEFLEFFYSNTIKLTMANITDVINLGHKYNVTECFDLCVRFLVENLTINNVHQIHSLAVLFEQDGLKQKSDDLISSNTGEVLKSSNFLVCDRKTLDHILKLDKLSCPETVVFEAVISWVKAASNEEELTKEIIQTHLGDLFHEIRFRSMTYDEFVDLLPSFNKLFTVDELTEILQMIRNIEFQPKMFNALPRTPAIPPWNEGGFVLCCRVHQGSYQPYRIKNIETTTFTTNKPLLLGGFACVPVYKYKDGANDNLQKPLSADVTIVRVPDKIESQSVLTVLHSMKVELSSKHYEKRLSKPIIILPKFKYEIRMNMDISEDCATYWDLKSEVQLQNEVIVTFHNDPLMNDKKRGVIWNLRFNLID